MNSNVTKLFGAVAVVVAAAALFTLLPDLKRYLKIERM
jgi:exosortase/archaeosortase